MGSWTSVLSISSSDYDRSSQSSARIEGALEEDRSLPHEVHMDAWQHFFIQKALLTTIPRGVTTFGIHHTLLRMVAVFSHQLLSNLNCSFIKLGIRSICWIC